MRIKLDIPLHIREIAHAIDAIKYDVKTKEAIIDTICTDTRECIANDLFIALNGEADSGERYVDSAIDKGCFVISASSIPGLIQVPDTSIALLSLAKLYKSKLNIVHTVAVTGSVGKSTTVKFISKILSQKYKVHSTFGNFNNHIGVPITILSAPSDTEVLVVELGMNHRNEISILSRYIEPTIGIITYIGTAHIGNLGSREEIINAKLEILDGMKDSPLLVPYYETVLCNHKHSLTIGCNSSLSHFALNSESDGSYTFISPYDSIESITFFDKRDHILSDLAFAISTAKILGLTGEEIKNGINSIKQTDLRQKFISLGTFTIFDDSYNASLESIIADFKHICNLHPNGAFLGDILELGEESEFIHKEVGKVAARLKIESLYLFGKYAKFVADGAISEGMSPDRIFINTDTRNHDISINHILENHKPKETILFKASHKLRFDKIADAIKERVRNE